MTVKFETLEKKNLSIYEFEDDLGTFEIVVDEESGDVELWYISDVDRFFVTKMERVPSEYPARGTKDVNKRTVKYLVETLIKALQSGKFDEYLDEIEAKEMFLEVFEDEASDELIETLKSYGSIGELFEDRDDKISDNTMENIMNECETENNQENAPVQSMTVYHSVHDDVGFYAEVNNETGLGSLYCCNGRRLSLIFNFDKDGLIDLGYFNKKDKEKITPKKEAEVLIEELLTGLYKDEINTFLAEQYFWTTAKLYDYKDIVAGCVVLNSLIGPNREKEGDIIEKTKKEIDIDKMLYKFKKEWLFTF